MAFPGYTHLPFTLILTKVGLMWAGVGRDGRRVEGVTNQTNDQHIQRYLTSISHHLCLLYHVLELLQSRFIVVIVVSDKMDWEESCLLFQTKWIGKRVVLFFRQNGLGRELSFVSDKMDWEESCLLFQTKWIGERVVFCFRQNGFGKRVVFFLTVFYESHMQIF